MTYYNAKEARAAGEKFFQSPTPCKFDHPDRTRRIEIKGRWVSSRCLECEREALDRQKLRPNDYEKKKEARAKWRSKNREAINAKRLADKNKRPFRDMVFGIKSRCKSRGIAFDISEEYLSSIRPIGDICPILGIQMVFGEKGKDKSNWMSIDRIKPHLGYVKGNVAIISYAANVIKQDCYDPSIFRRIADWLDSVI